MALTQSHSGSERTQPVSTAGETDTEQTTAESSATQSSTSDASADHTDHELPLDQVFELLKNSRRRHALAYLSDHDGEATIGELAEHIAAIENDVAVRAVTSSQRKRVYVGLYQCHLPKMDDTGVVEFDKHRGTVELTPGASQLDQYIEGSGSTDWWRLYLCVTAGGFGLLAVSLLGSSPFGLTPATVTAAVLAVVMACSALHAYGTRDDR